MVTIRLVGRRLKEECYNFLHITCELHANAAAEEIRRCYKNVN